VIDGEPVSGWWQISAVPFEDGYLMSSRNVTAEVEAQRLAEATRVAQAAERTAIQLLQEIGLPKRLPSHAGVGVAVRYVGAESDLLVGGDWIDAVAMPDGRIAITIGDVAGHGRSAAVEMVRLRLAIRALLPHLPLSAVGEAVDRRAIEIGGFATCCCVIVDPSTQTIELLNVGHLPPVLVHDGGATWVDGPTSPPLGSHARSQFATASVRYLSGSVLALCTDGLIERRGVVLDDSLTQFARFVVDAARADASPDAVADAVMARAVSGPLRDDACLVVMTLS
jgi:serine phosphatase RsbU (regulator of sigma subunit)